MVRSSRLRELWMSVARGSPICDAASLALCFFEARDADKRQGLDQGGLAPGEGFEPSRPQGTTGSM